MAERYISILKRGICTLVGVIIAFAYVISTYMTVRSLEDLIRYNEYPVKDRNLNPNRGQQEELSRQKKTIGSFDYKSNDQRSHNPRHR